MLNAFLEAANLTMADVAPGYNITPLPAAPDNITPVAPIYERATLPPTPNPLPQPWKPGKTWLFAILALAVIIFGLFYYVHPPTQPPAPATTATIESPSNGMDAAVSTVPASLATSTEVTAFATSIAQPDFGRLRFYDVSGILDEAILSIHGLPAPQKDGQYEAWLVGDETRLSLGVFSPDASGKAEINFPDEQGRNFLARYERLEITLEDKPDQSPNPSGKIAYSSGIPPMALKHIRHLLVAYDDTPKEIGLLAGFIADVSLLDTNAATLVEAYDKKDAADVRKNAEAIYNLLVGSQGKGYGDLDGNGSVTDPGDSYGLLLNGDHLGYIEGTIQHAQLAIQMPDASANVYLHGGHVIICGKNVEDWATQILKLTTQILADPLSATSGKSVREIAALADRMQNGRDLNGNEQVEPISGEGGAKTALLHAGYMTDMPILEGTNMLPPPAPTAGPGTAMPTMSGTDH